MTNRETIDPDLPGIDLRPLDVADLAAWNKGFDDGSAAWHALYLMTRRNFELSIWVAASGWMLAVGAIIALAINRFPL